MNPLENTRYPGLSSFTTAQKNIFFGRKQETRDLFNLVSVERTVVLFSKSGYGKTSLLQAGVMPLLYGQQMVPVPIRFGTDKLMPEEHFKIQFEAAYRDFKGLKEAFQVSDEETFWEQIRRCSFGEAPARFTPLLIFDQFEELFTLYPDKQQRRRFVTELADLIQERLPNSLRDDILERLQRGEITDAEAAALEIPPPMKFIFSIRSDMLHFMDELSEEIPYILRSRYQLFGLREEQAEEAILAPARLEGRFASPRFGYLDEALREILSVLSKNKEVESFQLQAVCQAIEEKIIAGRTQKFNPLDRLKRSDDDLPLVDSDFYGGREGIDAILEESYHRRLDSLSKLDENWPLAARLLLEDALVNKNDRRQSVDVVELLARPGIVQALLNELEGQRLLRKEPRLDSFYYEISHDTWLKPILKSRKARLEAEEKAAAEQRQRELEAQAAEEKRRAEAAERLKNEALRGRRRARLFSVLAGAVAVVAVAASYYAWQQNSLTREAETNAIFNYMKATEALDRMEAAEAARLKTEVTKYVASAKRMFEIGDSDMARKILLEAQKLDSTNVEIKELLQNR